MDYNSTTYIPRGSKRIKPNGICLTKNHIMLAENLISKIRGNEIELKYDTENKIIGIFFDVNGNGLKVKNGKVNAHGYFKAFDIQKRGVFTGEYNSERNCLIVKIGE